MSASQMIAKVGKKMGSSCSLLRRNAYCSSGEKAKKNQVHLEWVDNNNLGDELAPIIYDWMLSQQHISPTTKAKKTTHLMTVGSMLGSWDYNAVVWGTGIHTFSNIKQMSGLRHIQKFDVRAVRGPVTREALQTCGHHCPEVYGDPGILMPLIYMPEKKEKKHPVSVVLHYHAGNEWKMQRSAEGQELRYLDINTKDYKQYIDEMVLSEKIISSSLHGIILAEAYGIPTVFLNTGDYVDVALLKYYDWYYSTGRYSVKMARTIEEALQMSPMPVPDLSQMQKCLMEAFPYDLWE